MRLPRIDLPVGLVEWEVFVPDTYSARAIGGNVFDRWVLDAPGAVATSAGVAGGVVDKDGAREAVADAAETQGAKRLSPRHAQKKPVEPSQNVVNLQRRTTGVLPIRVDVPRAGTSHRFVKPLVVDQDTVVSFRYKRR
jgi:hypothetical protein